MHTACVYSLISPISTGTAAKIQRLRDGNEDDSPAQVLRVLGGSLLFQWITPDEVFTIHERFAPANIILRDKVRLLQIGSSMASFTEHDCDILNVRKFPLAFMGQIKTCKRLIHLPIKIFYDYVDKLNIEDRKVV